MTFETEAKRVRIRELNDSVRTADTAIGALLANGQLVVTAGVAALGPDMLTRALRAVRAFDAFGLENDPWGEHDFGRFTLGGIAFNWKLDCFDTSLEYGSPDPSDPAVTRRVLTLLLAEEY